MSNITMKDITIPSLNNTYTFAQVDNTLTTTGAAADAKKTGDEISSLKQDFANFPSGTYEDMTVGNAEQLVSSQYVEDEVPYLYRTTGGSADVGNRAYIDAITGVSIPWNQLVPISAIPSTRTIDGVTFTNNGDGTISLSGTATDDINGTDYFVDSGHDKIAGHKYLLRGCPSGGGSNTYFLYDGYYIRDTGDGVIGELSLIRAYVYIKSGTNVDGLKLAPQIFDLTQDFGSTIADYIYSLETATAGAGVAKLRSWGFFTDDYYAYNAGELKHVSGLVSHDTVGFNQWDEVSEEGYYDVSSNGEKASSASWKRCKNLIPCFPSTNYYFHGEYTGSESFGALLFYDADGNMISYKASSVNNNVSTTPANCHYMSFYAKPVWFSSNICINLSWSGWRNGEYESYVKHSYALDSDLVLRGIPKLDASNNLYYDGDTYESDGTVTRKYGIVDLGTLTWNYSSTYKWFNPTSTSFDPTSINSPSSDSMVANIINAKYPTSTRTLMGDLTLDKVSCVNTSGYFIIRDLAYTDPAVFKTAMSGVYLVYELATETTETADSYTTPQIVDDFGTEEYVTTGIIPVGHETRYPANLRDKVQHLPDLADSDGYYMINQTDKQMSLELFRIPKAPTTDGTYTLQASVSSGTPTYTWVSTT